jgi:hypothetical protein
MYLTWVKINATRFNKPPSVALKIWPYSELANRSCAALDLEFPFLSWHSNFLKILACGGFPALGKDFLQHTRDEFVRRIQALLEVEHGWGDSPP